MKEHCVFLAKFENADIGNDFSHYIVVPEDMDYDDMWKAALELALEYENSHDPFLLRGLTYLGMGIAKESTTQQL